MQELAASLLGTERTLGTNTEIINASPFLT